MIRRCHCSADCLVGSVDLLQKFFCSPCTLVEDDYKLRAWQDHCEAKHTVFP